MCRNICIYISNHVLSSQSHLSICAPLKLKKTVNVYMCHGSAAMVDAPKPASVSNISPQLQELSPATYDLSPTKP